MTAAFMPGFLAGLGVVALLVFLLLRGRSRPTPATAAAPTTDLIAEAEEEEARRSVLAYRAAQAEKESATESEDPAGLEWEEQEDVYRPEEADVAAILASLSLESLPALENGKPCILIYKQTYDKIVTHLKSDLTVEQGGLLVGQAFQDSPRGLYLLKIEDALPVSAGLETDVSFTYTPESWEALTPQLQQLDASQTILGSYHSHPGMGVFLSRTDLDTQETIFSQDWQLALVIDPVNDEVGFFTGKFGKPCENWHVLPCIILRSQDA